MLWKVNGHTMDLNEAVIRAIEDGGEYFDDVLAHVKNSLWHTDVNESEVREMYDEFWEDKMSEGYA